MTVTKSDLSYANPGPYYYLWHLISLGVLDASFGDPPNVASPTITNTVWDKLRAHYPSTKPATVALIDIGVSRKHPNLKDRIDTERSIDLVTHRYGARSVTIPAGAPTFTPEAPKAFFNDLETDTLQLDLSALGKGAKAAEKWFRELERELKASSGVLRTLIDTDETFGSHGTGIAGLVVGEPALTTVGGTAASASNVVGGGAGIVPADLRGAVPYFGVDPLSKLISIRSAFASDPVHFITAFLYAWKTKPDVILLPRGIPDRSAGRIQAAKKDLEEGATDIRQKQEIADLREQLKAGEKTPPTQGNPHGKLDVAGITALAATLHDKLPGAGVSAPAAQADPEDKLPVIPTGWDVLAAVIVAISKEVPIVCAAGNDGESQLIYPANLARPENGIIAVGAVTSKGYRSGYSNYGEHLTLVAPSDDGEVYNRHQMRIDQTDPMVGLHAYMAEPDRVIPYSPLSLLTTDLPGTFGYDEGADPFATVFPPLPGADSGIGGYYAPFGGTSGAAALVGGVAAFIARANKAKHGSEGVRLNGTDMKKKLVDACGTDAVVLPGSAPLTPDRMNSDKEIEVNGKEYFFGAGLLNASTALANLLAPPKVEKPEPKGKQHAGQA